MALSAGALGEGQLFWGTADSPDFTEDKSLHFAIIADGEEHDYTIPVVQSSLWDGQRITSLRLDPCAGPAGVTVQVRSIVGQ
jgi:hypothetical protein